LYRRGVRNMAAAQGFTEVYNYSFVTEEMAGAFAMDIAEHVRVTNPIASDQTLLRASLLPAIRKNILDNSRHFQSFRLFEIGREIHARKRELPGEILHFTAAMFAREGDGSALLFELKRLAECLMDGCQVRRAMPRPFEHPERVGTIEWRGEELGRLFELHPSLGIKGRASVLDLDLTKMEEWGQPEPHYQPLRRFPVSTFDVTVDAPLDTPVAMIERVLRAAARSDLVDITLLGVYTGPPLNEQRKGVSYRLAVGALDHTLSSDELRAIDDRVKGKVREWILTFEN
jgi:phenylalanyl-tRNA synthetase beta chain